MLACGFWQSQRQTQGHTHTHAEAPTHTHTQCAHSDTWPGVALGPSVKVNCSNQQGSSQPVMHRIINSYSNNSQTEPTTTATMATYNILLVFPEKLCILRPAEHLSHTARHTHRTPLCKLAASRISSKFLKPQNFELTYLA